MEKTPKNEKLAKFALYDILEPAFMANTGNTKAPGSMNDLFGKMLNHQLQANNTNAEDEGGYGQYRFVYDDEASCPYIPWGRRDNEPFLYKLEISRSGQSGAIIQRLVNMLTKQGVWHEVEVPTGYKLTESEQQSITETLKKAAGMYARLGLYNGGMGKDEFGNYTDPNAPSAIVEMVNNLLLFNIAPVLLSSKRITADAAQELTNRDFWQYTSVMAIPTELFRFGKATYGYSYAGGIKRDMPYVYMLPKPTFEKGDMAPDVVTALKAMGTRTKYNDCIVKIPTINPNKVTVDANGNAVPMPGVNLIECWVLRTQGVFDTGTYPIPIHSLGSFRNYRALDYEMSRLMHSAIVRGQHIRGIVRVYDIAYNSLDAYIDTGTDVLQSLKNRWQKDKEQILRIFTGTGNAGGVVVLPGMVPADAPQKHGTVEYTPVNVNFDTSLIDAVYATIKLELLSAYGIIDPRIVGVQLGKAGNLSDQAGLLEVAMEITKEFLETYVTVVNNFLASFNELCGISHTNAKGERWRVLSGISIDTPYLRLFSRELIELLEMAAAHPNEVRTLLGMDLKTDEEISSALTMQWREGRRGN